MIVVIVVIAVSLIILALIARLMYNKRATDRKNSHPTAVSAEPDIPVSFGYKCLWFAVKTDNRSRLASIFKLRNIQDCNWRTGIDEAYNKAVFVTPVIDGWTLVCGWGLIDIENKGKVKDILQFLSKEFNEAQFFCTHRVTEYHCWMKATGGHIERVYEYSGESAENIRVEGEPSAFELTLSLLNTLSDEAKEPGYFDREDITWPDEELVMEVARHWSIDPSQLNKREDIEPGLGLLGYR